MSTTSTYIPNGPLSFNFSIGEDGTVTVRNVNRLQYPGLHEGDVLLKLSNHMIKKNPTGIGNDDPVINLAEFVMTGDINNADERLRSLFEIYDMHSDWLRKVWLRRANTATTAAPVVATAAPVVATAATAGKAAAPATAKKRPRKQKKKLSNKIDTSFINVDIDVIASEVESAAANNSRNSNMSVIDLSGESEEEDSRMHAAVASSSRVAAARGATTKPRSSKKKKGKKKKKKGKKIKREGTRPRKETRPRSESMSSLSADDGYGSDDSSRYTAYNAGAPSAESSRSVSSRSAAASGASKSTTSSKKRAPQTHVPQSFKDLMWNWERTVTNGGRDNRPQISTSAVDQLKIGTEYQEFRNHENNQHVKEWDFTQLRKFISKWFANNAKFRGRRMSSASGLQRSSASSRSGNSQSSQSTKSERTKVPTSVKNELIAWGEENVDLYGVRRNMSIDDTAALRTSIQPQLINAGNQHVEHWTNNYWDVWIREMMSKCGTRMKGKNVGKDSDGVFGMCNICREKRPGLPGVNCPDCTIKIYHVKMLGINADGNVTYKYKDDDGEWRQAVVFPGDFVMYSSNNTTKENGVPIQFHAELAIQGRGDLPPVELFEKYLELISIKTKQRDRASASYSKAQNKRVEQRSMAIKDAIRVAASNKDAKSHQACTTHEFIMYNHDYWIICTNANEVLTGKKFATLMRLTHLSPVHPNHLEQLPDQNEKHAIGPNKILSAPTLALIRHCTDGVNANNDRRAWCGGLGFPLAYIFWTGHYSQFYRVGDTVYAYFCFHDNDTVMSRVNQFHFGGAVHPRHIGLCEMNFTNKNLETGPFMKYDMAVSFVIPDGKMPTSCKFNLVHIRDENDTMFDVEHLELDLTETHDCLKATYGKVVYVPPKKSEDVVVID